MSCCCGGGSGICCGCNSMPQSYRVPSPSVGDGVCTNCVEFNATRTLVKEPFYGECFWYGGSTIFCDNDDDMQFRVNLGYEIFAFGGEYMYLVFGSHGATYAAIYRKPCAEWDCLGENTLQRYYTNGLCTGWPDTMTVTPI